MALETERQTLYTTERSLRKLIPQIKDVLNCAEVAHAEVCEIQRRLEMYHVAQMPAPETEEVEEVVSAPKGWRQKLICWLQEGANKAQYSGVGDE